MKIAHLVCKFPPYRAGMGAVAFEEVKRLSAMGHEVTVFTLPPSASVGTRHGAFNQDSTRLPDQSNNFKIIYLKAFPRFGNGGFCPSIIEKLKGFDLVQLHYPFFGAQEVLWLGKKLGLIKAELVIFYHMDASFQNWLLKILSFKSWLIRRSLFQSAKYIACASLDYVADSKIKNIYQKHKEKFVEIPFGVSHSPDHISRSRLEEIKQQINWQPNVKNILFVGNLDRAHYFKGVDILLPAFARIVGTRRGAFDPDHDSTRHGAFPPNTKLLIVGEGDLRPSYESLAKELNIADRVTFTGRVSDNDLSCYYYLSDVVVLPSVTKAEAFGLVLAEAESFGKPVIGSDLPGVRSVVGEAGLLVKPGDADDLAEKIKIILTDGNLRQKFSVAGLNQVKEKYNWDRHAQKLNEIYGS
ncbi:MAG TPA: glycosyltransferase [Patescibacteria group bacterium]|nr:glycosyltransferase [Patescibacteria group bacterium]